MKSTSSAPSSLGIVIIGRNEGPRLEQSLRAALKVGCPLVYVDSGSTDGSVEMARAIGRAVWVEELDRTDPFTAARGRNAGFEVLRERVPGLTYVLFVDGDCVLADGWVSGAVEYLAAHPQVAIVAGQLREEHRDRNAYHRLADMEWAVPTGNVKSTGGTNLVRAEVYEAVGGYDGGIAAGEELELSLRIARKGFRIVRLPELMAYHDVDMNSFSQWWQRCVRSGQGAGEALYILGPTGPATVRNVASILTWSLGVPVAVFALAAPTAGWSLGMLTAYLILYSRIRNEGLRRGASLQDARLYGLAIILNKFANLVGLARFVRAWYRRELSHGRQMLRQGPREERS